MIEGEFVNFSLSRNVSLDVHFILLLDTNDELRGGDKLVKFAKSKNCAYLMCQHWCSGKYNKYFNTRFIKPLKNWRYKGSVHEWMSDTSDEHGKEKGPNIFRIPDDIVIYQDRTLDRNKSCKRFSKDKGLLLSLEKRSNRTQNFILPCSNTHMIILDGILWVL